MRSVPSSRAYSSECRVKWLPSSRLLPCAPPASTAPLSGNGNQDYQTGNEPKVALHGPYAGAEATERKVQRKQRDRRHGLKFPQDCLCEIVTLRHDRAQEERAEQRVNSDLLSGER